MTHYYDVDNRWPETTSAQRSEALEMARNGRPRREVAELLGLSEKGLSSWVVRRIVVDDATRGFLLLLRYALKGSAARRLSRERAVKSRAGDERHRRQVVEQSGVRKELDDCEDGRAHHFLIAPPAGKPVNPGRCKHCGVVESFPSFVKASSWVGAGPKRQRLKPVDSEDARARLLNALALVED